METTQSNLESEKSMSYVLRFNEHLAFDNTGDRVKLNDLALEDWIEDAKKMKEDGMSYREISDKLLKKGYSVSKSSVQRKLN
jgi:hypothetical protein